MENWIALAVGCVIGWFAMGALLRARRRLREFRREAKRWDGAL